MVTARPPGSRRMRMAIRMDTPSRCLPGASLQHLAEDDLVDLGAIELGADQRLPDDEGAKLGGGKARKTPEVTTSSPSSNPDST